MREPEIESTMREFKRRLVRRQLAFLVIIVPCGLAFILLPQSTTNRFLPAFAALVVILTIYDAFTWRCPSCNAHLSGRQVQKTCAKCGVVLRD